MRHIAFICANDTAPWGGSELLWAHAADVLVRRGTKVSIGRRAWVKDATQIAQLRELGCRIVLRRGESLTRRLARKFTAIKPQEYQFVRELTRDPPDLVVISQGNSNDGLTLMEICRSLGLRDVIITQAAAEQFWAPDEVAIRLGEAFDHAVANYFVCESNLKLVRRQFAAELPNAKVVRNPFGVSYDANPVWTGDPLQHLSLACVGRLDVVAKGQDILIDVLSMPQWRQRSVSLTLYGSGSNRRCIDHQIQQSRLSNIHIGGYVEDVQQVWSKHHAMVLASRFEGLPLAIVEAMLCGRPCIATDVAGNAEVICDNVNGFLGAAPTVGAMADAMERAWQRRSEIQSIGRRAAEDIRRLVPRDPTEVFAGELATAAVAD